MTLALGVVLLLMVAAFAGYTASYECLYLERRQQGRATTGRSSCVCGAPIPMYRNVPVVTWLLQRGRAACCGGAIPVRYLVSEALVVMSALAGAALAAGNRLLGVALGTLAGVLVVRVGHVWWLRGHDR